MKPHHILFIIIPLIIVGICFLFAPFFIDPRTKPSLIYAKSETDQNITITVSNIRLAEPSPQNKILIANICVQNPNHYSLSVEGQLVLPNIRQEISSGLSSNADPSCDDFEFNFSPDDEISQFLLTISSITNWSYPNNEILRCAEIAQQQKILNEWKTGIKISCQKNSFSDQWLENIDYIPPGMAETEANDWIQHASRIAFDDILVTHGTWKFPVRPNDIYKMPILTLLDENSTSPVQQELNLQASSPQVTGSFITIDVCLHTPIKDNWDISDAVLNYGDKTLKQFHTQLAHQNNCRKLIFNTPNYEMNSKSQLQILGITLPPNTGSEKGCKDYLPILQSAINKRYFGTLIRCSKNDENWYVTTIMKPIWMSQFDAVWLTRSTELYTVKGDWLFEFR